MKEDKHGYEFLMDRGCKSEFGIYRRYKPDIEIDWMKSVSLELHIDGLIDLDDDSLDEIDGIFMTAMDQLSPIIKEVERRIHQKAERIYRE